MVPLKDIKGWLNISLQLLKKTSMLEIHLSSVQIFDKAG